MVLMDYDPDVHELVFTTRLQNRGDVARFLHELRADVAEGDPIVICLFKEATEEQRRERIAQRRQDFFNS